MDNKMVRKQDWKRSTSNATVWRQVNWYWTRKCAKWNLIGYIWDLASTWLHKSCLMQRYSLAFAWKCWEHSMQEKSCLCWNMHQFIFPLSLLPFFPCFRNYLIKILKIFAISTLFKTATKKHWIKIQFKLMNATQSFRRNMLIRIDLVWKKAKSTRIFLF